MIRTIVTLTFIAALAACSGGPRDISGERMAAPARTIDPVLSSKEARQLFGAKSSPSEHNPASYGGYAKGCLAGGMQLADTGPTWQAMRLSRNRNWGRPELVDFVQDLSRKAAQQPGWSGLYVGDMSQPRGGPMLTGHSSHQIGLDADIWMLPADKLNLSVAQRENISSISMQRASGAYVNDRWTRAHHEILKAAASDPRVARIFVFPGAKAQMCKDETGDRAYLRKIRPWWGHHYHFHVRLSCPRDASGCVDQDAPPPGDGCAEAQDWVNRILNPPPPDPNAKPAPPRRQLTMGDLPAQCADVLASR
ncbi:penicillin-insensitive murein endopeptidase [Thetidibacter halocola]|uniref:Penicillin-insensitive murein endopeptidase n=1 Tax=Thetidibacter halocola TaxID=2827239 RepID=A0A8J8B777_9RHOB|nr:penicillin-insensitive murein endopeptidase [Thetidibacter halocola]MBS0123439.1 penicillin-insensitive murein endopeptidase [Thetidibacter halocola]